MICGILAEKMSFFERPPLQAVFFLPTGKIRRGLAHIWEF